jgi:hypothetical protein
MQDSLIVPAPTIRILMPEKVHVLSPQESERIRILASADEAACSDSE